MKFCASHVLNRCVPLKLLICRTPVNFNAAGWRMPNENAKHACGVLSLVMLVVPLRGTSHVWRFPQGALRDLGL